MSAQPSLLDVDPAVRREDDFYRTKQWQFACLRRRFPFDPSWTYVEPCAGDGALVRPLQAAGIQKVWTNDLIDRGFPLLSQLDAAQPSTWMHIQQAIGHIDVVVTNVPFSAAFPILVQAYEHAERAVISLLRRTWDEPTRERNTWLSTHPCSAQIVMPRADYRGTGSGDSATHAWFIWAKDRRLVTKPHDVVTIAEAEDLARQAGERL